MMRKLPLLILHQIFMLYNLEDDSFFDYIFIFKYSFSSIFQLKKKQKTKNKDKTSIQSLKSVNAFSDGMNASQVVLHIYIYYI